ncbi:MAG: hypothetical protein WD773_04975 [Gemmatimonadales bacterium]
MPKREYHVCADGFLDTSDSGITFDAPECCDYCSNYNQNIPLTAIRVLRPAACSCSKGRTERF